MGVVSELKNNVKILTAEKIYRYYLDKRVSPVEIERIRAQFFADDHALWYQKNDGPSADTNENDKSSSDENSSNYSDGKGGNAQGEADYEDRKPQEER